MEIKGQNIELKRHYLTKNKFASIRLKLGPPSESVTGVRDTSIAKKTMTKTKTFRKHPQRANQDTSDLYL